MGLSIHYSGRIKDAASLPLLIEEVVDTANIYGWKYQVFQNAFPNEALDIHENLEAIYGICFTAPKCETVSLTFLSNGVMASPSRIFLFGDSEDETERSYIYGFSVKTQFAGITTHAVIINFFRHLNNKYLSDFKMLDEGDYWETQSETVLQEKFRIYDAMFDNFTLALQTFPMEKEEDMIAYFERLMEQVKKLREQ